MARKIAVSSALVVFAVCLIAGIQAGNSFSTVVSKALVAMGVTVAVGLIVGAMAQKMLDENVAAERQRNLEQSAQVPEAEPQRADR